MTLLLLPRWFRWFGLAMLVCGLFAYVTLNWNVELEGGGNTLLSHFIFPFETAGYISYSFPMIGLLLIALAKLKLEDERTALIRMSSWHYAIFISVLLNTTLFGLQYFGLLKGLISWFYGGDSLSISLFGITLLGIQIILLQLVYLIVFNIRLTGSGREQ